MKHASAGQSLIEVVVAVGMMALLLVALLALVTIAVRNSLLAQHQAKGVSLSQGGIELMRALRDYSWTQFSASIGGTYDLPQNWVVEDNLTDVCESTTYVIDDFFSRCVALTQAGVDTIAVTVTTYWQEGNQQKTVIQTTKLSKWER